MRKKKFKVLAEEEHFIEVPVKKWVLMGLLLLLKGVMLVLFQTQFCGVPWSCFQDRSAVHPAAALAAWPQVQPRDALWRMQECVCEHATRVSVWWLRWFHVLLGTLDFLPAAWGDQHGWKAGGARKALGSFQKGLPQYSVCETIIAFLIHWLEGGVFRIRANYKAYEKENMSHDLFLSGKYYATLKRAVFF